MRRFKIFGAMTSAIGMSLLAACASTGTSTPAAVEVVDWTYRACEAPAYRDILGSYVGQFSYGADSAQACQWNTEISIIGVSMVSDCNLTGTISATPVAPDTNGYQCSALQTEAKFVAGVPQGDLNRSGSKSVIVHLPPMLAATANSAERVIYPITQYESLSARSGTLNKSSGGILSRQ